MGWTALGLSVLCGALAVATLWLYVQGLDCGEGDEMSSLTFLWPWSFLAGGLDFIAALGTICFAAGRGGPNRIVSILGGAIMFASPVVGLILFFTTGFGS